MAEVASSSGIDATVTTTTTTTTTTASDDSAVASAAAALSCVDLSAGERIIAGCSGLREVPTTTATTTTTTTTQYDEEAGREDSPSSPPATTTTTEGLLPAVTETNAWASLPASAFRVRVGPNYKRTGRKEPSGAALYKCVCADVFRTDDKAVLPLGSYMDLPENTTTPKGFKHPHVPAVFILHLLVPSEPYSLTNRKTDGPTYQHISVYHLTPEAAEELSGDNIGTASPAVQLYAKWCETAEGDVKMRQRMKILALLANADEMRINTIFKKFNGKPVLVTRSGSLHRGEGNAYLEQCVNVHMFGMLARKGLSSQLGRVEDMCVNLAFTIEGRVDEELPERVLGTCAAYQLPLSKACLLRGDDGRAAATATATATAAAAQEEAKAKTEADAKS
eukprot:UC1_evm1s593